jgi:signal recognition particle subunit SEC65
MEHNSDKVSLWPGYFNSKLSRSGGRRVPVDSSVPKPDLEGLLWAARKVGITKMKREEGTSHPKRPNLKEGRLWISLSAASKILGTGNKEEMMQIIGGVWKESYSKQVEQEKAERKKGPKVGDKRARSQFKQNKAAQNAARRALAAKRAKKKKY